MAENKKVKTPDMNNILFSGVITWKEESPVVSVLTMRVTMTPEGRRRSYTNYPRIFIFEEELRKKASAFIPGSRIVVEGYVTSSKQRKDENGNTIEQNHPLQSFVATDVRIATEEDGEANAVDLVGTVERAYVARGGNVNFILVSFRDGHYMKRIKVTGFPKEGVNYMDYMAAGTRVKVSTHCSTTMEDTEKGRITREFLIIDSIEKA